MTSFRSRLRLTAVFTLALTATGVHADDKPRPRDPWVFRSVLDGRARMLTAALAEHLYAAYDTQDGTLRRVWPGGVFFSGGVYDARHGPQPTSVGKPYFEAAPDASSWSVRQNGKPVDAKFHYLGYRLGKNDVTIELAFDTPGGRVTVDESPECDMAAGRATLVRTFKVSGLTSGTTLSLALDETSDEGVVIDRDDGKASAAPTTAQSALTFDRDGVVRLRTSWSTR